MYVQKFFKSEKELMPGIYQDLIYLYYILKYFINSSMKDKLKFSFKQLCVPPSFS